MSTYTVPVDGTMTKVEVPDGYKLLSDDHYDRLMAAFKVLSDMNRCEHGRHQGDTCSNCRTEESDESHGNLFLESGQRIGTQLGGQPIHAPERGTSRFDSTDVEYWGYER